MALEKEVRPLLGQPYGGYSSVGLERLIVVQKVVGSIPTIHPIGKVAELAERTTLLRWHTG